MSVRKSLYVSLPVSKIMFLVENNCQIDNLQFISCFFFSIDQQTLLNFAAMDGQQENAVNNASMHIIEQISLNSMALKLCKCLIKRFYMWFILYI